MKKLLSLLAVALFGVSLIGCSEGGGETPPPPPPPVVGHGWHLTQWEVGSETSDFPKDVYLICKKDEATPAPTQAGSETGTFTMYQDVNTSGYVKLTGTYTFDTATKQFNGKYSDNEAWAYVYTVSGVDSVLGGAGQTMTMTAVSDASYKLTFVYGEVPAGVIDSASPVRSAEAGIRIL